MNALMRCAQPQQPKVRLKQDTTYDVDVMNALSRCKMRQADPSARQPCSCSGRGP